MFFLTDIRLTGDPSPFQNFLRKFNLGFNVVLSKTIQKRIIIWASAKQSNRVRLFWFKVAIGTQYVRT